MTKDVVADVLTLAAGAVGDTLNAAGLDSEQFAFTLVLWPVGRPWSCSSICGSGHPDAPAENTNALAAASEKVKGQPSVIRHQPPQRRN